MDKTLCLLTFFSCHFVCVCVLTEAMWKLVSRLMSRAQLAVRDPPMERRTGSWYQEILIRWPSILHHQQVKLMTFPSNVIIREKVLCCDDALLLVKNHFGLRKDHVLVSLWLQIDRYNLAVWCQVKSWSLSFFGSVMDLSHQPKSVCIQRPDKHGQQSNFILQKVAFCCV